MYQYERRGAYAGWRKPWVKGDPAAFMDDEGNNQDEAGEDWQVLVDESTDPEGWQYGTAFDKLGTFRTFGRGLCGPKDRARRRRWEPPGGLAASLGVQLLSAEEVAKKATERSDRKGEAIQGVLSQLRQLMSSRSLFRNMSLLDPSAWRNLRRQHLEEYQAFLDGLAPAQLGREHQLPESEEILYAFRFTLASYGSGFTVDAATYRRALLSICGFSDDDVLTAVLDAQTLRPAFTCLVDHDERRCVLFIRGTTTSEDALTNTVTDAVRDEDLGGEVHAGILQAARWVLEQAVPAMKEEAAVNPDYELIVTGHSLGAGTAALATLLLDCMEPRHCGFRQTRGIGFATPGVACADLAGSEAAMRCFTTIVVGRDMIVRTCVPHIYILHHQAAMAGMRTRFVDSVASKLGGRVKNYADWRHNHGLEVAMSQPASFPIGRCIQLADVGEPNARALLAQPTDFKQYFLHPEWVSDHGVDRYEVGVQCLTGVSVNKDTLPIRKQHAFGRSFHASVKFAALAAATEDDSFRKDSDSDTPRPMRKTTSNPELERSVASDSGCSSSNGGECLFDHADSS